MRKDGKIELLKTVPLFSHCKKKELAAIASLADLLDVRAGKTLVKEGAQWGREFMIIVEGAADVQRGGRKVDTLGAGDFFGEIALISGGPRTATITATEPTTLLVVTDGAFHSLLAQEPSIQANVLKELGARLQAQAV